MKIFYWSPFISKVATTSSVIRSAESIVKYSKKKNNVNIRNVFFRKILPTAKANFFQTKI